MEWPGSRVGTCLLWVAAIGFAAIPLGDVREASAQSNPTKADQVNTQSARQPTVRVTTRLLSLNVAVTAKDGETVRAGERQLHGN